jgi:hypothetical protein
MGLFSKRDPCAICGGKVSGLFPWKIEGQYVCNACHGIVDLPDDMENHLTMQQFRSYIAFRNENQKLREIFRVTDKIDLGTFGAKILFDCEHQLFCMSKNLDTTIFEGSALSSFTIREDSDLLYEGSAEGLVRHTSDVPQRARAMAPEIAQFVMQQQLQREMERSIERMAEHDERDGRTPPPRPPRLTFDQPELFHAFSIELQLNHPYWNRIEMEKNGPSFSSDFPDINDYLNEYQDDTRMLEDMVQALMKVAFPKAPVLAAQKVQEASAAAPAAPDTVTELRRYKALMEEGILTAEEFEAKKKQLLGI